MQLTISIVGVMISTAPDPNNFANFTDSKGNYQMVVQYFSTSGEGEFCAPINISAAGIDGLKDGANVTLQFVFSGGDGNLYQVHLSLLSPKHELTNTRV